MKTTILSFGLLFAIAFSLRGQTAQKVIQQSLEAHGNLHQVENVQFNYISHKNWIEQSEKPEGPFIVSYEEGTETFELATANIARNYRSKHLQAKEWAEEGIMCSEAGCTLSMFGHTFPAPGMYQDEIENWALYHPEGLLNRLAENKSVAMVEVSHQGSPHFRFSFSEGERNFTLYVKADNFLLSTLEVEAAFPHHFFFSPWGKLTSRVEYGMYSFLPGGYRYPVQWDVYRKELPWKSVTLVDVAFNVPETDSLFQLPDYLKNVVRPKVTIEDWYFKQQVDTLSKGIYQLAGNWNVGVVELAESVMVLEAPLSAGYSEKIQGWVKEQFPKKPISQVICSSDAWPHVGGVAGYASTKTPIWMYDASIPLAEALIAASGKEQKANFTGISGKQVVSDSERPFEITPIGGEGGDRYLAVYFPQEKILYTSDLVFKPDRQTGERFMPQYLTEIIALVEREGWEVETLFGMHLPATPYQAIVEDVAKIRNKAN